MQLSGSWKALIILCLTMLVAAPVLAQDPDGFGDSFDDPALPGWEHNESVSVAEGMLHLSSGGFAAHPGEWGDLTLNVELQYVSGEGALMIGYHASETGTNVVVINHEQTMFQHLMHGQITDLGAIQLPISLPAGMFNLELVAIGEQQTVSINGMPIASAPDFEPLPGGGITFEVIGDLTILIDSVMVSSGGELPAFDLGYGEPSEGEFMPSGSEPMSPNGEPMTNEVPSLYEDFDAGRPGEGWEISDGWTFEGGIAHTEGEGQAMFVLDHWREMSLSARLLIEGEASLVFLALDEGAFSLTFLPDMILLFPPIPPEFEGEEGPSPLAEAPVFLGGEWHDLRLVIQEAFLTVWLDGKEVLHFEGINGPGGAVGIVNHTGRVELDVIEILPLEMLVEGESPVEPGQEPMAPPVEPSQEPQPVPSPANGQSPTGVCTISSSGNTNVRTGPTTQDPILGILTPGTFLPVSGRNAANWYQVKFNGQPAWISGDVTQLNGPCNNLPLVQGGQQPPVPGPGSSTGPGSNAIDLAVTDIYPETPTGPIMFRITNNGPANVNAQLVSNCTITRFDTANNKLSTNAQNPSYQVNLTPGQTAAFNTNFGGINTSQEGYDITCSVQMGGDTNNANNSYSESFRPMVQVTAISADLVVTDLFPKSQPKGQVFMRITNNGPDALVNASVEVTCRTTWHPYDGSIGASPLPQTFNVNLTLNPGQTSEHYTHFDIDTTNGWYDFECEVNWMFDSNSNNNTYSETFPPPP